MKLLIFLFITTLFQHSSFAYTNELALRAGVTYARPYITANNSSNDELGAIGFNTHFGYKWDKWSVDLSSYFYWGSFDSLNFKARNETIQGNGGFRNVSFSPMLRYHLNQFEPIKGWNIFFGAGPVWSLESISLDTFTSTGNQFSTDQKITYETFGAIVAIGFEENLKLKEDHPFYVELSAGYKKSYEVSVVDKSDSTEIQLLSQEEKNGDLRDRFVAISFGILIF